MSGWIVLFLNMGTGEFMLIFLIALLLFGGDKMPGIARTLGRGIRDFKNASEDVKREITNQINSFDEKEERKKDPYREITEESYRDEIPVSEENENPVEDNNTDNDPDAITPADNTGNVTDREKKPIDFTKPENTIEYKG